VFVCEVEVGCGADVYAGGVLGVLEHDGEAGGAADGAYVVLYDGLAWCVAEVGDHGDDAVGAPVLRLPRQADRQLCPAVAHPEEHRHTPVRRLNRRVEDVHPLLLAELEELPRDDAGAQAVRAPLDVRLDLGAHARHVEVALDIRHGTEGGEDPDPIRLNHDLIFFKMMLNDFCLYLIFVKTI